MEKSPPGKESRFAAEVGSQVSLKLKAQRQGEGVWFGLGMLGLIGWSVAGPTVVGACFGLWLDRRHHSTHSWTLAFLMAGLVIGCTNAWQWVAREDQAIRDEAHKQDV